MIAHATSLLELFGSFWNALQHGSALPLGDWNYLFLFVFVIIQGTLVKLMAGAVVADQFLNLYLVIVVSICASLVADIIWFRVGSAGNIQRVFKRRSPKQRKTIEILQKGMRQHYFKILFIGKMSAGLAIPATLAAGMSKIPLRRWLPPIMLGEGIFTSTLILIGFFATSSLKKVDGALQIAGIGVSILALLVLLIYLPLKVKNTITEEFTHSEVGTTD